MLSAFIGSAQIMFGAASSSNQIEPDSIIAVGINLPTTKDGILIKANYNNLLFDESVSLIMDLEPITRFLFYYI